MIYVDSSVAVAAVLSEGRRPSDAFWTQRIVASRLTDLEMRVRAARGPSPAGLESALDWVSSHIDFVEISRASVELLYRQPPRGLRALDAIHLATMDHLNQGVVRVSLASYDRRMVQLARGMGFDVIEP